MSVAKLFPCAAPLTVQTVSVVVCFSLEKQLSCLSVLECRVLCSTCGHLGVLSVRLLGHSLTRPCGSAFLFASVRLWNLSQML